MASTAAGGGGGSTLLLLDELDLLDESLLPASPCRVTESPRRRGGGGRGARSGPPPPSRARSGVVAAVSAGGSWCRRSTDRAPLTAGRSVSAADVVGSTSTDVDRRVSAWRVALAACTRTHALHTQHSNYVSRTTRDNIATYHTKHNDRMRRQFTSVDLIRADFHRVMVATD